MLQTCRDHVITLAVQDIQSIPGGEELARQHREEVNNVFLRDLSADDFVGVQCYTRRRFSAEGALPPETGIEMTQLQYEYWPYALEESICQAFEQSKLPVLVTESGIATTDDRRRIDFVRETLKGVANCLNDSIPVIGYTYWSALDNFEWMEGYEPRFGLIDVDRQTQQRMPKPISELTRIARFLTGWPCTGLLS